jgi:ParB-like chromosome segregation protein Spo0J
MDEIKVFCSHTEMRDPVSLVEHPRNYNTHPAEQIRLLAKIIKHQGWRNPITVSKRSGYVVKGHGRLAAAMLLKCDEVPIDLQDYKDEASELAEMIADNRIAELAEADQDALKGLLLDENFNGFDIELTGFDQDDFDRLLKNEMQVDHMVSGEEPPKSREELEDAYLSSEIRQIVLIYEASEYENVTAKFEKLRKENSLTTNVDVVDFLLAFYERNND